MATRPLCYSSLPRDSGDKKGIGASVVSSRYLPGCQNSILSKNDHGRAGAGGSWPIELSAF